MKQSLLFCLLFFFAYDLSAQQLPLFTQFREHHVFINPGTPHTDYITPDYYYNNTIGFSIRRQWVGLDDAPTTYTFRYERIFTDYEPKPMLGLSFIHDQTGPTGIKGGYLRGGLGVQLGHNASLHSGISVGLVDYYFNPGNDILSNNIDPDIFKESRLYLDLNMGIYLKFAMDEKHNFYSGFSVLQITPHPLGGDTDAVTFERKAHLYGLAGAYFTLGEFLIIEPSAWLRYVVNAPFSLDLAFRIIIKDQFWLGTNSSWDMLEKLEFNRLSFELGCSFPLDGGKHEIRIRPGFTPFNLTNNLGGRFGPSYEFNSTVSWKRTRH